MKCAVENWEPSSNAACLLSCCVLSPLSIVEDTSFVTPHHLGKLSTLILTGLLGKQSQTLEERVEPLSRPRAEATEEGHASGGAVGAARVATDCARNDQRAHATFGQVVVRGHLWSRDKDEQFG